VEWRSTKIKNDNKAELMPGLARDSRHLAINFEFGFLSSD